MRERGGGGEEIYTDKTKILCLRFRDSIKRVDESRATFDTNVFHMREGERKRERESAKRKKENHSSSSARRPIVQRSGHRDTVSSSNG